MRMRALRYILLGIVAGAVGEKFRPAISKATRPVLRTLAATVVDVSLRARAAIARAREDIENVIAEAEYEHSLADPTSDDPSVSKSNGSIVGEPEQPLSPDNDG